MDIHLFLYEFQIKDIMAKAQAVIEERKKAMANLHPVEPKPATNGAGMYTSITPNSSIVIKNCHFRKICSITLR